jgi:acyl dehydratase
MPTPREGETHSMGREFTREDVERFADLSGDRQPRHLEPDENGRLMIQGLLTATLPTSIGGDLEFLAREMTFEFVRPVYTGETVACELRVDAVEEQDDRFDVSASVTCRDESEPVVLRGSVTGLVGKE